MSDLNRVETFEEHIEAITDNFDTFNQTEIQSDDARIAVIDFECGRERWVSLICEDGAGEVTQMNIAGSKAIAAVAAILNAK